MGWQLEKSNHKVFEKNTLVVVASQLRFHPILLIKDGKHIAEFQEKIRSRFPIFSEQIARVIVSQPNPSDGEVKIETLEEKQYLFKKEDGSTTILLSSSSLALENRNHEERSQLISDFDMAINALLDIYAPVSARRIGLRYVNVIDKSKISGDLGREVNWAQLITEKFLTCPEGMVNLENTLFYSEFTSPMPEPLLGAMTLRYGLIRASDPVVKFRFDTDRYLEGAFDVSSTSEKITSFADDIFSLFISAAGPELQTWMKAKE